MQEKRTLMQLNATIMIGQDNQITESVLSVYKDSKKLKRIVKENQINCTCLKFQPQIVCMDIP